MHDRKTEYANAVAGPPNRFDQPGLPGEIALMMVTTVLLLAVLQTPQNPTLQTRRAVERTAYDSTVSYVGDVGVRVAEVRSGLELFHRAAYNEAAGSVLEKAALLLGRCQALAEVAAQAPRRMCTDCMTAAARPAFASYRAGMRGLGTVARQCSRTLTRLSAGRQSVAVANLRREERTVNSRLVAGLRDYEARLTGVRRALGWTGESPVEARRRAGMPERRP